MPTITPQQIIIHFRETKKTLLRPGNRQPLLGITRRMDPTVGAGVYFLFDCDNLMYVGESGNLYGRMSDLNRTLNHTFRRSLGEAKFHQHKKYYKASSSKKFDAAIETLLDDYVRCNITISLVPLNIGRKEFEEWMQETDTHIKWLNKRSKRK